MWKDQCLRLFMVHIDEKSAQNKKKLQKNRSQYTRTLKNCKPYCVWIMFRSSRSEVFLRKGVLKYAANFTGEYPWRSVISKSHVGMGVLL